MIRITVNKCVERSLWSLHGRLAMKIWIWGAALLLLMGVRRRQQTGAVRSGKLSCLFSLRKISRPKRL